MELLSGLGIEGNEASGRVIRPSASSGAAGVVTRRGRRGEGELFVQTAVGFGRILEDADGGGGCLVRL